MSVTSVTVDEILKYLGEQERRKNAVLWTGAYYMGANQTANLSEPVSAQSNGIVLIWSAYTDGTPQNHQWQYTFIPKYHVMAIPGQGVSCVLLGSSFTPIGSKYVYVYNSKIVGYENNRKAGSANGITYKNNAYVLRKVIGI